MFSKYDVYVHTQSIYCYPGSNVLKNKLGIKDLAQLKAAEEEITAVKQFYLLKNPIPGRFTKSHLLRIHQFIFEDIYPFAGRIRREQISKGTTMFYPPDSIERELNKVFEKIKQKQMLHETTENQIFDHLAYVMAELNIIHPFREGNGRAIREFIRIMALKTGYALNWGNTDPERILNASIASVDDYHVLIRVLKDCIDNE